MQSSKGKDWHKVALSRMLNSAYRKYEGRPDPNDIKGAESSFGDCHSSDTSDTEPQTSKGGDAIGTIRQLREQGLSLREVADTLNERGIERPNGNDWHHVAVSRALDRHDPKDSTGLTKKPEAIPNQTTFSVSEVSNIFQVSPELVRQKLNNGTLPGVKFGRKWRVSRASLKKVCR